MGLPRRPFDGIPISAAAKAGHGSPILQSERRAIVITVAGDAEASEVSMAGTAVERAFERHVAAVHAGDREAFLSNFADDAVVEDPVGISPLDPSGKGHRGHDAIAAFWDIIIGPGSVRFEFARSIVCGNEMANVGAVHNTLPDGGGDISAEGVFVYRVNEEGKLASLKAYWDYEKTMGDRKNKPRFCERR